LNGRIEPNAAGEFLKIVLRESNHRDFDFFYSYPDIVIFERESPWVFTLQNPCCATRLAFRTAESACQIDDKAYQQNQAKPAAADGRTAKVKPAAPEQEKKNKYD
jgi:hypothetical protein